MQKLISMKFHIFLYLQKNQNVTIIRNLFSNKLFQGNYSKNYIHFGVFLKDNVQLFLLFSQFTIDSETSAFLFTSRILYGYCRRCDHSYRILIRILFLFLFIFYLFNVDTKTEYIFRIYQKK